MDNNNNNIIWQKWFDPFGLDDSFEIPNELSEDFDNFSDDMLDEEDLGSPSITEQMDNYLTNKKFKGKVKVIATPMGIIPLNDNTASNKIFNFWVGHTNFDITFNIASIIEHTEGVETLDIFTRYRFRVGIGKAFDDSTVMRNINNRIYKEMSNV